MRYREACRTYGRQEMHINFLSENPKAKDHLRDLGVGGGY
jgi:hypothetical protein